MYFNIYCNKIGSNDCITAGGCGGHLMATSNAVLTSPGYPNPPTPGLDCTFLISVEPSSQALMRFRGEGRSYFF